MYLGKFLENLDISTQVIVSIENSPIKVNVQHTNENQWLLGEYWLNKKIKSIKFTEEDYQEIARIILYKGGRI
jgi:hypothetical protein